MDATDSLPDLVTTAQANAKALQDQIDATPTVSDADRQEATTALELITVDIFAVFESRMQRHFKRGPFARKLKAALLATGQADLADRVHQYYLAINVLKHGTGASYRELLANKSMIVTTKPVDETNAEASLVDVTVAGFFDGLCATILDAYHFLEKR